MTYAVLAKFLESPDAESIMEAMTRIPSGALRQVVIDHMTAIAELVAPARVAKLIEGPLLAESLDGRVYERHLRGESYRAIAGLEQINVNAVRRIIRVAKGEVEEKPKPAPKMNSTPRRTQEENKRLRDRAVALRLRGMSPAIIRKLIGGDGVSANFVHSAVYDARQRGTVFPDIDYSITSDAPDVPENSILHSVEQ